MTTAILAHYSRMLGHGVDWNMDEGAVYHAGNERGTATLCGYESDAPQHGASDRGWQYWGNDYRYGVTCKRCLRLLKQGEDQQKTQAQLRRTARRRDQRVKEAFDRLRDYLGEATRRYQPDNMVEDTERKAWRQVFAECAYELLRHTREYKGFQNFTEADWSRVESGALSRIFHEYYVPLLRKEEEASSQS
jgi:alpha-L-fucosidase